MNYLTRNQKSIAWHMVQDAKVLLTTFQQWQAHLELGDRGDRLWVINCELAADRIENATQMAKSFSIHIARYCDDFFQGRAPGFKEAIEFAIEATESGKFASQNLELWAIRVDSYGKFFADAMEFHRVLDLPEWKSKLPNTYRPPWQEDAAILASGYVTAEGVSLLLRQKNKVIAPKTLKNSYKAKWGKPDGNEGRAELFEWNRIRPIIEGQFDVEFGS